MTNQETSKISTIGIFIWILASGFFLYEFFLRTLTGTLATQVIADLSLSPSQFAVLGSAYFFAYGLMQIPVGIIADRFGLRSTMIFAVAVCAISAFCLAASHTYYAALLSRVLMGFGSSFAFVCVLMVVADHFPSKNFAAFAGASQFIGTMGPLLSAGPLASLLIKYNGDWRYILCMVGFSGIALLMMIALFVKDTKQVNLDHMMSRTPNTSIFASLKQTFENKQVMYISMYSAMIYASMSLLGAVWGTMYLQAHHFAQPVAANAVSVGWLGYAIGCLALGPLSDLIRSRRAILISCALLGVIATTGITFINSSAIATYDLLFLFLGIAASGQSVACAAISEHADPQNRATAFGMNNGTVMVFNVTLPPTIGYLVSLAATSHSGALISSDFHLGFVIMPILFLGAFINATFYIQESISEPAIEPLALESE